MAFVWKGNDDSRQASYIGNIMAKASTTFTFGQALIVVTGRWETAVGDGKVGGVYNGPTVTTGANDLIEVIECRAGDRFLADYVGTPDATFLAGMQTADISVGGVTLNAADVTTGAWAILRVDTANTQALVRPKLRQFS